ncbi:transglutaminase-like domain-containing protein [Spirochaetota bacterium]
MKKIKKVGGTMKSFTLYLIPLLILFSCSKKYSTNWQKIKLSYITEVKKLTPDSKELKLWIPIPKSNRHQEVSDIRIKSPYEYVIKTDNKYKNRYIYIHTKDQQKDFSVAVNFTVKRLENKNNNTYDSGKGPMKWALKPNKLIPVSEVVKKRANDVLKNEKTKTQKARTIYMHTLEHMEYNKKGKGWGRGDFNYACLVKKGNCTDFHSYYIALMRSLSIPSYFEIGLSVPKNKREGEIKGYHCWAYYWDGSFWVPVDISEADKNQKMTKYYFGSIDEHRIAFTIGRDILLNPKQNLVPLNFFIYPYAEVDGLVHRHVTRKISFKKVSGTRGMKKKYY